MDKILHVLYCISPIISIILSSAISYKVADKKAKTEIKKVLLQFDHEDKISIDSAFADMLAKSGALSLSRTTDCIKSALDACTSFIAVSLEKYIPTLSMLDKAIRDYDIAKIEQCRNTLIQIKSNKI